MLCTPLPESGQIPFVYEYLKLYSLPLKLSASGWLSPVSSAGTTVQQWLKALKYCCAACKGDGSAAPY